MRTTEDIERLLAEVGPLDERILEVVRVAEDRWVIRLDALEVDAEFDARSQRLRFSVEIGVPRLAGREAALEFLLVYNAAARESDDVVMALSGPGGSVMQMKSCDVTSLQPRIAAATCVNLAERALLWRAFIVAGIDASPRPHTVAVPADYMLRV